MNLFIRLLWEDPPAFFIIALTVIFSICFHEFCHAWCALLMGDSTAADAGHLTLNPLRQMGPVSLLMMLFLGFAWGAVPVDPSRLRSRHSWGPLAAALAGPAANLLLALTAWILFGFLAVTLRITEENLPRMENLFFVIRVLGIYNIVLFCFNLIPAPGLDGWSVLRFFFPRIANSSSETVKGFMVFLIFAAMMGVGYLFSFADFIMRLSLRFFQFIS